MKVTINRALQDLYYIEMFRFESFIWIG